MKNYLLTLMLLASCFIGIQSCTSGKGENANAAMADGIPAILERTSDIGADEEREKLLTAYDNAVIAIRQNPEDAGQYLVLAQVFITEARLTGNTGYYNLSAVKMLDNVLNKRADDKDLAFQALTFKSGVLLSMHQFKDALDVANQAYTITQHNAQIMGALVDAHVELGEYAEAVTMCDNMINLRPDIRSYSRVSYLRQIHGDNAGAIEAMKMAVEAGAPGAESTEWARIILGDLYLMTGDLTAAEVNYKTALGYRKNYPYAYAALGRLEKAKMNYDEAIKQTEEAIRIMSDVSFVSQLADLYELKGNAEKAKEIRNDIVDLLEQAEKDQNKENTSIKHNGARELATAYLKAGDTKNALKYAEQDLAMRPANIDANELVAWIYFVKGDHAKASVHADKMLATNSKNPNTLYKAGLIYNAEGNTEKANSLIAESKTMSSSIDPTLLKYSN